ncbi:hypothetical protein E6C60_3258 [Paenibacillus algicola]|uniref:VWFA domain-containing protein n=1 Tax=Paenibacillus algicola TaxID=2565926 RepID=A0A4P8XTC6_9BACL|nr:BatA domain-containing protein [Paenibacillus algicola]QCT03969.1 hypothetical protein E6C60_3258 [Paenibacillus algicola]
MGIQSWLSLWFGLSLPAIVLMYLFKRKYIDTPVPSHMLWNRVLRNLEANRPWQKLQNRLLLWLQLLAAALLVFALMQPFLQVSGGGSQHLVIVADTSGSMSAEAPGDAAKKIDPSSGGATRLELLKERLVEYTGREGRGRDISLVAVGARPAALLSRESSREDVVKAIEQLQPYYGQASYRESLSLASALTREDGDSEVVIFTDGQWKDDKAQIAFEVPVGIEKISGGNPVNAAVEQFGISGASGPGASSRAVAVITSNASSPEGVEVSLYGDGKLLASQEVPASEGERQTLSFDGLPYAEVYRLALTGADHYKADNEAYAFGYDRTETRVLLLTPGNFFLEKALQLGGSQVTRVNVDAESEGNPAQDQASKSLPVPEGEFDLIVLDGPMPETVQQGEWEKLISRTPLWTLGTGAKGTSRPQGQPVIERHPVTAYLSLSGVYIGSVSGERPSWGEPIVKVGGTPVIYAGTEAGHPRLSFDFRLQDSDLPLSPEFPVLVSNVLQWITSDNASGLGRYIAGTVVNIPVALDTVNAQWLPAEGYVKESGYIPPEALKSDKGISAAQTVPDVPGLYRFEQVNPAGETVSSWLAVAPDPFEGNLAEGSGPAVSQLAGSGAAAAETGEDQEGRRSTALPGLSLLPWLALLALLVIALEWGVYQRGRSI